MLMLGLGWRRGRHNREFIADTRHACGYDFILRRLILLTEACLRSLTLLGVRDPDRAQLGAGLNRRSPAKVIGVDGVGDVILMELGDGQNCVHDTVLLIAQRSMAPPQAGTYCQSCGRRLIRSEERRVGKEWRSRGS